MKILYKINLLVIVSVLALITLAVVSMVFKTNELQYYSLVETVKTLQTHVLEALVGVRNYEKSFKDEKLVYDSLDEANGTVASIDVDLLETEGNKIAEVTGLLVAFSESFTRMTRNSRELLVNKNRINELVANYADRHRQLSAKIDEAIADSFLYTDLDTTTLQELKNNSLAAFAHINGVALLVNQDLLLDGNIERFSNNFEYITSNLATQEKNIRFQVSALKGEFYLELSQQLTATFNELQTLIPELISLYKENQKISSELQIREREIGEITAAITRLAERVRKVRNQMAATLQLAGQGVIILLLLLGAIFLGRSITKPLAILTVATDAITPELIEKQEKPSPGLEIDILRQDELGHLARSFAVMRDAIQRKIIQLKEVNETIEAQNEELKRVDKLKDEIMDNTSHELRTPLNGIIGIAESMIDGATGDISADAIDNLSMIASSGRRLSHLVNNILDFSKLRQQKTALHFTDFNMRDLADLVVNISRATIGSKNLELVNSVDPDLPGVEADEAKVQQIMFNIVGNSIKFCGEGKVEILAKVIDSFLEIAVTDTGIGIEADKLERIFDPFQQIDGSSERQFGGTGLGLTITKQLVEAQKGEIRVESTPGKGSTFFFSLPVSEKELKATGTMEIASTVESTFLSVDEEIILPDHNSQGEGDFHILVVDDEKVNLQAVTNQLKLNNYKVTQAEDGIRALEHIEKKGKPDLILLDIMMPRMSGYEVCRKIRDQHSAAELPIIMLTAKNQISDLMEGFEAGANEFLSKPFSKNELLARIRNHLNLSLAYFELSKMHVELSASHEEQIKIGRKLRQISHFLRNIINSMPSVIVGVDDKNQVTQWNTEATNATGVSSEDAQGRSLLDVFPQLGEHLDIIGLSMRKRKPMAKERIMSRVNGKTRYTNIMIYPLMTEGDMGAVVRMDDVTTRVQMEESMVQTEKMMSLGGMAAGMAHEINNPLSGILQSTQNIVRRLKPDFHKNIDVARKCGVDLNRVYDYVNNREILKFIDHIRESGIRASSIIKSMLNFSRKSDSIVVVTNLSSLLDESLDFARRDDNPKKKYDFRSIKIVREFDPNIIEIPCVRSEIQQVLLNLLKNAAQAMFEDENVDNDSCRITLRTKKVDKMVVIEVEDNGPGIPREVSKRIFEPFFTTKEVGVGTGLGLSVSYFIITTNHQGEINVESELGKGTTFTIKLPFEWKNEKA